MSGFAVTNVVPRVQAIATLGQTVYYFTFQVYAATDLNVYNTPFGNQPNDPMQILSTTLYTVTLNPATTPGGPYNGGYITLTNPSNGGDIVTIVRNSPMQRQNYYVNGGLFDANMVNPDFNNDVLFDQQNSMYDTQVTPHYNLSAAPVYPTDILVPQLPANCTWQMNSTGTQIVAVPINTSGTTGNVTVAPLPTTTNAFAKFSNTAGTITSSAVIEATPGNLTGIISIDGVPWPPNIASWLGVSVNTAMVAGTNYFCLSPGGTLVMTLPTTIPAGVTIEVAGYTATGWKVAQSAGQQIYFGNQATTAGATGYLASTNAKDNVELLCVVANTTFVVLGGLGNITVH